MELVHGAFALCLMSNIIKVHLHQYAANEPQLCKWNIVLICIESIGMDYFTYSCHVLIDIVRLEQYVK